MEEEEEDLANVDSLNGACQFESPPPSAFSRKKVLYDNDEARFLVPLLSNCENLNLKYFLQTLIVLEIVLFYLEIMR